MSYNLSSITLPSLATLPSASRASLTLQTIQQKSTAQLLTLATVSSLSLLTAYNLASPRGKHPYLLWTALVAFLGGQGIEYWYNGLSRFPGLRAKETGYVEVEQEVEPGVNGEKVEAEMGRERWTQAVRTGICGVGFVMGVVGVWGDGA